MFITIDIGNSHQSYAVFNEAETFVSKGPFQDLPDILDKYPDAKILVSSVDDEYLRQIPASYTLVRKFFNKDGFLDMPTHYSQTIGDDRLAVIYYVFKRDHSAKVVVDCGTFTTLDFLNSKGHLGGYIIPGEQALRAGFGHGKQLKDVNLGSSLEKNNDLPQNTKAAMEQGLLAAYLFSIKGLIKQNKMDTIYLTGGNAEKVAKFLKSGREEFKLLLSQELLHRSLCYIAKRKLL